MKIFIESSNLDLKKSNIKIINLKREASHVIQIKFFFNILLLYIYVLLIILHLLLFKKA